MHRVAHKPGKHHVSLTLSYWGDFYHHKKTNHKMFQVRGLTPVVQSLGAKLKGDQSGPLSESLV